MCCEIQHYLHFRKETGRQLYDKLIFRRACFESQPRSPYFKKQKKFKFFLHSIDMHCVVRPKSQSDP